MNERIKTSIASSSSMMRVAAIMALVSQGISLVASVILAGKIDGGLLGTILSVMLAVFLLQGANAQEAYAKGGNENELLEGLKKETAYWQITAILSTIALVFFGLVLLLFLVWGEVMIQGILQAFSANGGRF